MKEDDGGGILTFEYFDNGMRKTGQIAVDYHPDYDHDFDLCLYFCEPSTPKFPQLAKKVFREELKKLEKRINETKIILRETGAHRCKCCFPRLHCSNCKIVAEYFEETIRIWNYSKLILDCGLGCNDIYQSNDRTKRNEMVCAVEEYLCKLSKRGFDKSFDPKDANVFFLVDECNGKYRFENISLSSLY